MLPSPGAGAAALGFGKGLALGVGKGIVGAAKGIWALGEQAVEGGGRLLGLAKEVATDPAAREQAWQGIKDAANEAKAFGEYMAEDPLDRLRTSRDGVLAAKNWAVREGTDLLEQERQKLEAMRAQGRASEYWGEAVGRAGFEVGSMFIGVGELAKLGMLGKGAKTASILNKVETPAALLNKSDFIVFPCGKAVPRPSFDRLAEAAKKLRATAGKAKVEADELATAIADQVGGRVAKAPLKSEQRIIEKAVSDYGGDVARLKDVARNTIVIPRAKIDETIARLNKHAKPMKVIDPSTDAMGYSGANASVPTSSGMIAEIQVNTPEMIFAKEAEKDARAILGDAVYDQIATRSPVPGGRGHKLYEEYRAMNPLDPRRAELVRESKAYYDAIRSIEN